MKLNLVGNDKEKIAFSHFMFEVTRRCNFKCEHCLRGDAQNVDLSENAIDNLLDQTLAIGDILFTGGEPLLAVDKIEYIIDGMIKRGIPFQSIQIITNGTLFSEKFYEVIRKAYVYMLGIHEKVFGTGIRMPKNCLSVLISHDEFHERFTDSIEKNLSILKGNLEDIAYIKYHNAGIVPSLKGRGKQLKCGTYAANDRPSRIEVYGKNRECFCPSMTYGASPQDYITVMCDMCLTAKGILIKGLGDNGEYTEVDLGRFNVADMNKNKDVLSGIDAFNRKYPTLCLFVSKELEEEQALLNSTNVEVIYKKIQAIWKGYHYNKDNSLYDDDKDDESEEENRRAYFYKALTERGKTKEEKDFLYNIAQVTIDQNFIIQQAIGKDELYQKYPYITDKQRDHISKNGKYSDDYISLNAKLECKDNMENEYSKNTTIEMIEAVDRFIHTDFRDMDWNRELFYSLVTASIMNRIELPKENKAWIVEKINLNDTEELPLYDVDAFYSLLDKYHNGEIEKVKLRLEEERFERLFVELSMFITKTDLRFIKREINNNNCHRLALEFFGYYEYYMEQINHFKSIGAIPEEFKPKIEEVIVMFNKAKSAFDFVVKHPHMASFVFALRDLN